MALKNISPVGNVFIGNDGKPLRDGTVQFTTVNSNVSVQAYKESSLTDAVKHADPVQLNGNGRPKGGGIWINENADVYLYDKDGVLVDSQKSVNPADEDDTANAGNNLVLNGSFELDSDGNGVPDNWTVNNTGDSDNVQSGADNQHGAKSFLFTNDGTGEGILTSTDFIAVKPSYNYEFLFDLLASAANIEVLVDVIWYTDAKVQISTSSLYSELAANPTSWTQAQREVTSPATAKFAKIQITGVGDSGGTTTGTLYIDNVIFRSKDTSIEEFEMSYMIGGNNDTSIGATTALPLGEFNVLVPGGSRLVVAAARYFCRTTSSGTDLRFRVTGPGFTTWTSLDNQDDETPNHELVAPASTTQYAAVQVEIYNPTGGALTAQYESAIWIKFKIEPDV